METRLSGNAFQILAAATGKARLPTVESLKGGTTRRLMPEERSESWSTVYSVDVYFGFPWYWLSCFGISK